jgi:hypothetical protein
MVTGGAWPCNVASSVYRCLFIARQGDKAAQIRGERDNETPRERVTVIDRMGFRGCWVSDYRERKV